MLNVLNYMLSRIGIHAGLTLRVAGKTDISIGYAHFIQENVRLQVFDGEAGEPLPAQLPHAAVQLHAGRRA